MIDPWRQFRLGNLRDKDFAPSLIKAFTFSSPPSVEYADAVDVAKNGRSTAIISGRLA